MKKLMLSLLYLFMCYWPLQAEIIKTSRIEKTVQETPEGALILFNIAEVLMDTEMSLGTQAWRKYIRTRVNPQMHDEITLYVFKHVAPKTPEPQTAAIIAQLQKQGFPVLAFTSRGRHE